MFTERYKITDLAVKLDKTLFEQIYAVKDTAAYKVSGPVTEKGDKVNVIWNFDSAKLSATQPDATTLKVTNTLSPEAQAIVDTIDTAQTTVAQAVNFSHSGNLTGETTVYVLKEGTTTLENLKLYYINTTSGEIELVDLNNAAADGYSWTFEASDITNAAAAKDGFDTSISFVSENAQAIAELLIDGQQEPQTEQTTQGEENSETSTQPTESEGTASKLPLIAIAAVIIIAGIIFFVIKRKKDENEE